MVLEASLRAGGSVSVGLYTETLTDGSQVYNLEIIGEGEEVLVPLKSRTYGEACDAFRAVSKALKKVAL